MTQSSYAWEILINISNIQFQAQKATENDIFCHLRECDSNFIPPLSSRVLLKDYARKIFKKAVTFEAWSDGVLVGLIAAYFDISDNISGYITNVSILNSYMKMGIAGKLIKHCMGYAKQHGFDEIRLEVNASNNLAIQLYRKFGFMTLGIKDDFMLMSVSGLKDRMNVVVSVYVG